MIATCLEMYYYTAIMVTCLLNICGDHGAGNLAAGVCDANSYCESGECCCHDEMYGTCYTWACCLEGSTCDAKNMKCKSKGRRGPALSEAAAVLEDVLDTITN